MTLTKKISLVINERDRFEKYRDRRYKMHNKAFNIMVISAVAVFAARVFMNF